MASVRKPSPSRLSDCPAKYWQKLRDAKTLGSSRLDVTQHEGDGADGERQSDEDEQLARL